MKTTELKDYNGLGRAVEVSDGKYALVITLDMGPRIMRFTLEDGENILGENVRQSLKLPDGSEWHLHGGHRVWHSPESFPRTYLSDSAPVEHVEEIENGMAVWQKEEPWTHMVKGIQVTFQDPRVEVRSRIRNAGAWPVEISAWAITVVSRGGQAICPIPQEESGLLPHVCFAKWPYTRMNDPRLRWGDKYFYLIQDESCNETFKIGYANTLGWAMYLNKGLCFQKRFQHLAGEKYPDLGSSFECYIADWGLEMETLSPMVVIQPGQMIEQVEWWRLEEFSGAFPYSEAEIDQIAEALSG